MIQIPTKFVDKAKFVRAIFTDVENEYDILVHLMTLSMDWVWRRRMFAKMYFTDAEAVLDLACGTGLVTYSLTQLSKPSGLVVGLDLSPAMLHAANRKKRTYTGSCGVEFIRAVGEYLPFRDGIFRYVTIGLALRNFADKFAMFRESARVLIRPGWLLSVDFVKPDKAMVWRIYRFHIFHVIPTIGGLVSAHWKYTLLYLANSILKSASPKETRQALLETGFRRGLSEQMTLGVVALIGGQK